MVTTENGNEKISKYINSEIDLDNFDYPDNISEASSSSVNSDKNGLGICPTSEGLGNIGKIVVDNSNNVHIGNKTFYQGPVTIKQFLYNNSISDTKLCVEDGQENPELVTENGSTRTLDSSVNNTPTLSNGIQHSNLSPRRGKWWKLEGISAKIKLGIIFGTLSLLILIILFATYGIVKHVSGKKFSYGSWTDSDEQDVVEPVPVPQDPDAPPSFSRKLRIISRGQWVAQPPKQPANKLKTPVPYVVILHTATDNCTDFGTCVFRVRYIQTFHIDSNGWWDIGYNFLVGGDGLAYEGRGWASEGAHTYGYNFESIGIAFIGTFNDILPPPAQMEAAKKLIEMGIEKGVISKNYKLFAHRQLSSTQSPGQMLYEEIKKWPHWSNKPDMYNKNDTLTNKMDKSDVKAHNDSLTSKVDSTTVKFDTTTVKVDSLSKSVNGTE